MADSSVNADGEGGDTAKIDYLSAAFPDIQRLIFKELSRESLHNLQCASPNFDAVVESHPIDKIRIEGLALTVEQFFGWSLIIKTCEETRSHASFTYTDAYFYIFPDGTESFGIYPDPERAAWVEQERAVIGSPQDRFYSVFSRFLRYHAVCSVQIQEVTVDAEFIESITEVLGRERIGSVEFYNCNFVRDLDNEHRTRLLSWIDSNVVSDLRVLRTSGETPDQLFPVEWMVDTPLKLIYMDKYREGITAPPELLAKIGKFLDFYVPGVRVPTSHLSRMLKERLSRHESGVWCFMLSDSCPFDELLADFGDGYTVEKGEPLIKIMDTTSRLDAKFKNNSNGMTTLGFNVAFSERSF